jgi:hypothetical protein
MASVSRKTRIESRLAAFAGLDGDSPAANERLRAGRHRLSHA